MPQSCLTGPATQQSKRRPAAARRRELLLESCEERILCDAAPVVTLVSDHRQGAAALALHAKSAAVPPQGATPITAVAAKMKPAELRVPFGQFTPAPAVPAHPATASASTASAAAAGNLTNGTSTLTSEQRAAVNDLVKDSTQQIWFQENVGQFPPGVRYGFKTTFGSMLVYNDHLRLLVNQWDATTGTVGVQAVDISFPGGAGPWQITPGGASNVTGSYQQPGGATLAPHIFNELTLKNVYTGIDLRLYSASKGVLEFDWIVAKAQEASQIRIAVSGQDGLTFNPDGSATIHLRYQDLTLRIPESYQLINGHKELVDAKMVAGDRPGEIRYQLTGHIDANAPLVIDPNVAWATFFDLNDSTTPFDSYAFAVTGNGNGVYVAGWVREIITNGSYGNYMEVNAGFSQGTVINQNYLYRLSSDGLHITAWTSTGRTNDNSAATNQKLNGASVDEVVAMALFPDGRLLAAFNSGVLQIYSADLSTRSYNASPVTMDALNSVAIVDNNSFYASGRVKAAIPVAQIPAANIGPDSTYAGGALGLEGVIIRYSGATTTPTPDWATYVGGAGDEYFTSIALTPDHTKLVFATTTAVVAAGGYPTLVNAVDATSGAAGTTELLVGVLNEQATKPAAFKVLSFLGGSGNEGTLASQTVAAFVTASNTGFWVAGTTSSADLAGVTVALGGTANGAQTSLGGGASDAFISYIPLNGSAGAGFQSTYVGGAGADLSGGLAYDPVKDTVFLFGTTTGSFPTQNTTPASLFYSNTFAGGTYDIFIATYLGNLQTKTYATYLGGSGNDYVGQTGVVLGQGHVFYNPATDLTYLATTTHSTNWPASEIGTPPGKDTVNENSGNDTHIVFAFNINIFDYGDAPLSYEGSPSTPANDAISDTLRLGATVTAEAGPQSGITATGDAGDDGIATLPVLNVGDTTYSVVVSVLNNTGSAKTLQGWIDFNGDGTFEVGEYASVSIPTNASQQSVTLTWNAVPAMTAGQSYLRLRLNDGALTDSAATANIDERSVGLGGTGEVEDYALAIVTSSVAGTVYSDQNNDGLISGAEPGIAGVTLTLTGTNNLGAAVSRTTTTDASGNYTFSGLRPSDAAGYTLTETQPAGFLDGKNTVGTSGGTTVNNPASDVISGLVLAPSTTATGYLFGELAPASVGGTVYHDQNANGAQDAGEPGISGVTVTLTGTDDLGQAVNTAVATNGTGAYVFNNLRPGTYTLTETQPAAYLDGKETAGTLGGTVNNTAVSQTISTFTIAAGDAGTGYLFGEVQANSLAGTVYRDLNNNGAIDAGETGVSGATVTLTGTNDFGQAVSVVGTTTAAGAYSFAGLRPGTYVLTETQPAGLLDGKETLGTVNAVGDGTAGNDTFTSVVLQSAGTGANYNFGELPPSSVAGRVFNDLNNNGTFDAGDSGIGSVTLQLTGTDDLGNAVSLTTTTAASGAYTFSNLRPGSYTVAEPTQPAGFLDGREGAGTAGGSIATNEQIGPFTLASNTAATGYRFAELTPSSLSGTVYVDANNNGVVDAGETLLPGVGVTLTGTDDLGQAVSLSTSTNASGAYAFTNLRPGTYTVTETQPGAYLDGKETVGAQGSGTINNAADSNTISAITLVPATTGSGNNFGELGASSLGGSIWADTNNNGIFDAGESAIAGATVTLTGTDDRGNAVSTTATTSASGAYLFANLRPGSYALTETQPAGFLDGKDTLGSQGGTLGNDTVTGITLAQGVTGTNNNFAELAPAALSGTVYRDLNNDGAQAGAGETGIAGVTITLTGTNDLGAAVNLTATTDGSGNYAFANLRPGTYTLTETQPAAFLDGRETAGALGGTVNNAAVSQTISGVTVGAGANGAGYLFGELPAASLSGTVYRDDNNDGVEQGAEPGLSSVNVTLTGTDDFGNAVNVSTSTDAAGAYAFNNLRPGTYTVTETQPAAYLDGKETAGLLGGTVNNAANSNTISSITVTAGANGAGNLFGELQGAGVTGNVYVDLNNNGVLDAGEGPISGVTITLTGTDDRGNAVSTTATSDGSGAYAFANLRPGTYTINETQPAAYLDGKDTAGAPGGGSAGNDVISGITIGSGTTSAGNIFGELPAASVSGSAYVDANNDGVFNAGETALPGVTISLTGTDDLGHAVSLSTATDATGAYAFIGLRPGTYAVSETQPAGYLDGKDTAGAVGGGTAGNDTVTGITLVSGTASGGNIFGELRPASLAGSVYVDANNNGVLDAGETAIAGATVTLTGTDDLGQAVSLTATTGAGGGYSFTNLRPGTYTLSETQPAGYLDGKDALGTQGGTLGNDTISGIGLTEGTTGTGNTFGELQGASIAGSVYRDANNDGVLNAGENGVAGVTITLTGTDDLGQAVSLSTSTGAGGAYAFSNLRPGTYSVAETQPAGLLDGKDTAGSPGGGTATNDLVSGITLVSGRASAGNNFGELDPASVSGSVYIDANNDGIFQAGETPRAGVTLTLTGTDDRGGAVSLTTTTDATGLYTFANLRPGSYTVSETQPAGLLDGKDTAGAPGGGTAGNDVISGITLVPGRNSQANSFGELRPASIGGSIWSDSNNNGVFEAGETPIAGATVTLTGTDDLGNAVSTTATTDASGAYVFNTLRPGSYTLSETQPAGFLDGKDTLGTQGGTLGNDTVTGITLAEGAVGTGNNFAELAPAVLSGTVYRDLNNDGAQAGAGETGIAGTTVTVAGTDDLGQAVSLSTTTDGSGNYAFANLRPGTYTLTETQPAGLLDGKETAGALGGTVDNTANSNTIAGISVTAGANGAGNLFGELPPASLSGSVYNDANNNGVRDGGEAPISGVTLTLTGTDDLGHAVSLTATSDATGAYAFANLRPGSYAIAEAQPAGFSDGKDAAGTAGGTAAAQPGDTISGITLPVGTSATGYTFGEVANSGISGAVYDDANNNGSRDAGEAGLSGIQVRLTGSDYLGNSVTLTATTDGSGAYSFTNVAPSDAAGYTLTELSQPAGYLDGKETAGTTGGTVDNSVDSQTITAVVLPAGQASSGNLFGEIRGSVLSGVIYRDLNNDGAQAGAGETGISGVTVTVTGTDDRGHAVSFTTTSDAAGAYSFANLRPSDSAGYTLTETQPAGLLDGKNTVGSQGGSTVNNPASDVIQTVQIAPGTTGTANNFGELPAASLSGFAYNDANNDGSRDAGEAPLPGVTITLTGTDDLGNAVSTTALTDAAGAYSFNNLRPGSYTLTETQPAGLLDGRETAGSQGSGTVDNTADSNTISAITLTAGQAGADNNFADLTAASFGGAVYRDLNNDGVRDPGETGIAGASITITGTDDRGAAVSLTVATDASGAYVFNNLRPGSYTVTETQPAGFLDGADTRGTISGNTPGTVTNDQFGGLTLAPGATGTNYIFGELPAASLSGTVYRDDNNDGVRQAGEPALGGVTVTLTGTDDLGQAVTLTMQSAPDGTYSFTGLRPGTYALTETQPAVYLDGKDTAGSLGGSAAATPGDTISGIVVASQQNGTGYNFGELAGSSIAGTVFVDANNNGALDAGETLLSGVSVTLTGTNDLGQSVNASAMTDGSGAYTFGNLRPGTYTVSETQPAGYLDGRDAAGSAGGTVAGVPGDAISAITLPSNTAATGYTFGELRASSLSGAVFSDANNNGVRDAGEAGIATTVTLTGTDDLGQAVTLSVTSDATTGAYSFTGLRPGTYVLTETQPAAFLDGRDALGTAGGTLANDQDSAITLVEGTTGTAYNFGEVAGSSLAGTVYRDDNNNGVLDAGEVRLSGVTVTLTGTGDLGHAVSFNTTTDVNGAYSFANLRPSSAGGYTITETEPAGFLHGQNSVGSQGGATTNNPPSALIQTVQITPGTTGTSNNFGELAPSSLGGVAYVDANDNGVLDAGETRLPGVAVTLTGTDDLGNAVSLSTTTGPTGAYLFNGLRPGTYTVSETQPAGYLDGTDTAGTSGGTAAAVPGDAVSAINLASNTPASGYNFGELRGASLAGVVFRDDNNDGAQQAGEPGIGGVSVRLRGIDDLGNAVDTTIATQPDGTYAFSNLRPGTYRVTESQPAGMLDGKDALGTASGTLANDDASGIVLREGDAATGYTFGELGGSQVTGTVFDDRNNNGVRDPGEAGISGVLIVLTGTDDLGQAVSLSVNTDPSGNYQFTGLRPGAYTLTETQPAGWLDGQDTAGTSGGTVGLPPADQISAISLSSNTNADRYLFAELAPAQVSGTVYRDDNNDGLRQAGESGLGGVGVTLTGTDDLGHSVSLSMNTAPDGTYSFANLRPGTYTLSETQPAGYLDGTDAAGTQGGTVAAVPGDSISGFTVAPGQSGSGNNFGELAGSSISGHVFDDRNNDGVQQAGESGLGGVAVTLTGTDDLGQSISLSTNTAPDGTYSFGNLRPGTYSLTETQPAGFLDGTDTPGSLSGTAAPVPGDAITAIVVPSNQTATAYNFAELAPSSIGGSVFADANNDGVRQAGENGIGGVSVTLTGTDDLGQAVNVTMATAPDGTFDFTNLRPGTYTVTETQPAAYADGQDSVGTLHGTLGNDTVGNIVVTPGQSGTGYTFGEQLTSVTGTVFLDGNRDGVQDPGETGLAGVGITLLDQNGNFVASTTTGPGGDYAFATLVSGPYRLVETQPPGYGSSTPDTVDITVSPAGDVVRFGETLSSLSGTVYFDANASGALNAGDPGLGGVTLTLTGTDAAGAAVNRTTTTAADGTYLFDNLLSGNYTVSEAQPAGYQDGAETAGNFSGSLATNDAISAIAVPAGQDGAGYNFGELGSPVSGVVYRDDNHDGVRDPGEPGLPGVTLQLLDPQTMLPIATVTTDPSGRYVFDNLPPGSYIVRETQPIGYADTTPNDLPVTVAAPGPADLNFGEKLGSLTGTVFDDRNNDGVQEAGEPGIANVTVTLTGVDDLGHAIAPRTVMTDANGGYTIDNLLSGTYTLTETQPAGYNDGKDSIGTAGGLPSGQDSTTKIALGAGVAADGYNFGELGAVDLAIAKDDGVTEAKPGQHITYTVTVSNQGVQNAAGVVVTDQFPAGDLEFISASNGGVYDAQTGTITWQLGNLTGSGQEVVTLTIDARVKDVVPAGHETLTNVVTVHDDGTVPDSNPANNHASDQDKLIAQPDLYVVKTDHLTTAQVGQTVTYTITGGNAGNQVADGVTVTDLLPAGLRFVSASRGGRLVNGDVVWKLGDLQPGGSFQLTVTVTVEESMAGKNVHNTAKIDDRYGSFEDPTPRNNHSSDDTGILEMPYVGSSDPAPYVGPAPLFYDLFNSGHNTHFRSFDPQGKTDPFDIEKPASVLDVWRDPVLPLAPIYSGEADPGSTLVIELYNANGDRVGEQTVMVDAGGNWLASFPSSHIKDYPSGVRITEYAAPYAAPTTSGRNLRNFFAPALNAGQFSFGGQDSTPLDPRATAPLLNGLNLGNPLELGDVKYGSELLPATGAPGGY